ncbi:MAG: hypothetical protein KDC38_17630 [Planctomycetes bacterium]|nr:hypothetical protein [Planctomycetota bacterium]
MRDQWQNPDPFLEGAKLFGRYLALCVTGALLGGVAWGLLMWMAIQLNWVWLKGPSEGEDPPLLNKYCGLTLAAFLVGGAVGAIVDERRHRASSGYGDGDRAAARDEAVGD